MLLMFSSNSYKSNCITIKHSEHLLLITNLHYAQFGKNSSPSTVVPKARAESAPPLMGNRSFKRPWGLGLTLSYLVVECFQTLLSCWMFLNILFSSWVFVRTNWYIPLFIHQCKTPAAYNESSQYWYLCSIHEP